MPEVFAAAKLEGLVAWVVVAKLCEAAYGPGGEGNEEEVQEEEEVS